MIGTQFKYSEFCQGVYDRGRIRQTSNILNKTYNFTRYMSNFSYDRNIFNHLGKTGSIARYPGKVFCRDVIVDIDRSAVQDALDDTKKLLKVLLEIIPERHVALYFSGNKGFHVVINSGVWGFAPGEILPWVVRETVRSLSPITIDESIYAKTSLIRIPNSRHQKTGMFKRRLSIDSLGGNLSVWDIFGVASSPEDKTYFTEHCSTPILQPKSMPKKRRLLNQSFPVARTLRPCVDHIKQYGVSEGDRNKGALVLACELQNRCGWSPADVNMFMTGWNSSLVKPPLTDRELQRTLCNAHRGYIFGCSNEMLQKRCTGSCVRV